MTVEVVELRIVGGVAVVADGVRRPLGGPKSELLLAVLIAHAGQPVSCDRLVDALWPHDPPKSAVATIQSLVSRLRSVLDPGFRIDLETAGYHLVTLGGEVDMIRFERLVGESPATQFDRGGEALGSAVAAWHGPAFGIFADHPELRSTAVRVEELRLVATDRWMEARLATDDAAQMVGELESLVVLHPLRETYWRLLMVALYRCGRQADALRRAAEFRSALQDETGLSPSAVLVDLEAQILDDDPRLAAAPQVGAGRRGNRTAQQLFGPTEFIGRDMVVSDLASALIDQPVITIVGPGGVGKTRLATWLAATVSARFDHGVTVVELASQRDLDGTARVIARALDIQPYQLQTIESTIEEHLTSTKMLLVLDNCEHLIDAVAPLVDRLRSSCPELRILATSREPLGLAGEYVHVLHPLHVPSSDASALDKRSSAAVLLFAARAASATPGFVLTDENVDVVADICRRLDGLPLGVELATARLRTMGVGTLSVRLSQRAEMAGQAQRGADGRHRTLHHLVEWSYDMLTDAERSVFEQLSVFAGGFDLTAAEAVCSLDDPGESVLSHVSGLVDKSMVVLIDPTRPRYRVLEPLREFGLDRSLERGDVIATEDRHLEWFLGLAMVGAGGLDSPDELVWSDDLEREFDNFRAAHVTAVGRGDARRALSLVTCLAEFAIRRVQYEITTWAEATTLLPGVYGEPDLPMAIGLGAYGHFVRGDMAQAVALAEHAVQVENDTGASGGGLPERVLGNALFYLEHTDEALGWMRRMLDSARRSDNPGRTAHALYMLSVASTSTGDSIRGAMLAGEAWEAAKRVGSPTASAQANYARGLALESVDPDEAFDHLELASDLAARAGNRWVQAFALTEVHWLSARRDDPLAALRGYANVVDLWYRGGDWANQWLSLRRVLAIFLGLQAFEPAAVLHGALNAVGAAHALPFEPTDAEALVHDVDRLRSELDEATFVSAEARGASMTDHEIVTFVNHEIALLTNRPEAASPIERPQA
ncbi:MAG: BTAD domain-containing putative transcriptional regulator [Ilumatobacteraceae bacterium]